VSSPLVDETPLVTISTSSFIFSAKATNDRYWSGFNFVICGQRDSVVSGLIRPTTLPRELAQLVEHSSAVCVLDKMTHS
jgi:hypothetical protein